MQQLGGLAWLLTTPNRRCSRKDSDYNTYNGNRGFRVWSLTRGHGSLTIL